MAFKNYTYYDKAGKEVSDISQASSSVFKNPSFGNVSAMENKFDLPGEGELFFWGGSNGNVLDQQLGIRRGGKVEQFNPAAGSGGATSRRAKANLLKSLGLSAEGIKRYSIDIVGQGGLSSMSSIKDQSDYGPRKGFGLISNEEIQRKLKSGNQSIIDQWKNLYNTTGASPGTGDVGISLSGGEGSNVGLAPENLVNIETQAGRMSTVSPERKAELAFQNQWQDPATGQPSPAGVGMPQAQQTAQAPISFKEGLDDTQKEGITNLSNKPADQWTQTDKDNWNYATNGSPMPGQVQQATLTSPTGEKKVVDVGSNEASQLLSSGWSLGDQVDTSSVGTTLLEDEEDIDIAKSIGTTTPHLSDTTVASAKSTISSIDAAIQKNFDMLYGGTSELSKAVEQLMAGAVTDAGDLTGRGEMQIVEEQKRQIEEKNAALATKNTALKAKVAEIDALTSSYNLESQREEGRPQTLSRLQGSQAQQYKMYMAQKNMLSAEAGYLQAEMLGMQGEVKSAQDAANRAVDLEFADRESAYTAKVNQLNILIPYLEKQETKYANAVKQTLEQQQQATADAKAKKKDIIGIMGDYITAGGTDSSVFDQILGAESVGEAMKILGTNMPQGGTTPEWGKIGIDIFGQDEYGWINAGNQTVTRGIPGDMVTGNQSGYVSTSTGQIYDIGSYATDSTHEAKIQSILNNIGQMTSTEQMDNYIQQVAPGSEVTGQMIANASKQYQVSWEAIMAIMQQDSSFATAGLGAKNNNPGNVGQFDSLGTQGVAGYATMQEGVNAVANNLSRRSVNPSEQETPQQVGYQPIGNARLDGLVQAAFDDPSVTEKWNDSEQQAVRTILAQQGVAMPKVADPQVDALQFKLQKIDELLKLPGFNEAVGPNYIFRDLYNIDEPFNRNKANFIAEVERLASRETLNNLIEIKERGGTFGALSEKELQMLIDSATKIGQWRIESIIPWSDKVVGYRTTQKEFKKEIDEIKRLTISSLERKGASASLLTPEEESELSNVEFNPSNYY